RSRSPPGRTAGRRRTAAGSSSSSLRDRRYTARMRILYGVVGEGMGHAMRSRVILDELVKEHQVQVVVSGRAYDYLQKRASENLAVRKIWGYTLVYEDNEVDTFKTAARNLKGALTGWPENI